MVAHVREADRLWVKICGVTREEDALVAGREGASAIGLNFCRSSPRYVSPSRASELVKAGPKLTWVGVFVDEEPSEVLAIAAHVGLDLLQLHGFETPEIVASLGPQCFKAARIGEARDVDEARSYPGEFLLVDAKVPGAMGGTGATFDWGLIDGLVAERKVILAGGLRPDNVEAAVRRVRPFGVDTASGVESSPGVKDARKIADFVRFARKGTAAESSEG